MKGDKREKKLSGLQHKRRTLSQRLATCQGLIKGSLVLNRRRCGKPGCRCAQGELHESLAFTYKQAGKSVLVHIPEPLEPDARQAQNDYRKLKALVAEISAVNVELLKNKAHRSNRRKR
jgi:hypothetical protein